MLKDHVTMRNRDGGCFCMNSDYRMKDQGRHKQQHSYDTQTTKMVRTQNMKRKWYNGDLDG